MMRAGILYLAGVLFALLLAGCGELPTSGGTRLQPDVPPSLAGDCIPNTDGVYICPPISGGPVIPGCDPYHYECGPAECMTSTSGEEQTVQACPGTGGSSGPGTGPGGSIPPGGGGGGETPPDTCQTGDEVLDSPAVRQMLHNLWQTSNPTAAQPQRLEQAGWIVQNADGSFGTIPFTGITQQGPCGINGNFYSPPNAVAWVHTHPFQRGEEQVACGPYQEPDPVTGGWRAVLGPDGQLSYPVYENRPSASDRAVMETINHIRHREGLLPLSGLIIDHDRTTVFTEEATEKPRPFRRCGY